MEATKRIDDKLLDNAGDFTGEFYDRFKLRTAAKPLKLTDEISKDYLFPTFYGEVTCAIGIFMCDWAAAAAMTPHEKIMPVKMPGGRSLVIFSCYIYRNVLGVAPYNEIAMTIPVMVNPMINVPLLPMILPIFKSFGYYVFSMPVTSLENQLRGLRIWGLPKVVQRIDIETAGDVCTTDAYEETGERYLRLRVPTTGKKTHFDVGSNLYSELDGELLQSETNFKGDFNMIKNMGLLFSTEGTPEENWLELGDGPSAEVLKKLKIDPRPFQFRYADRMSSCFDMRNPDYKPSFDFSPRGAK